MGAFAHPEASGLARCDPVAAIVAAMRPEAQIRELPMTMPPDFANLQSKMTETVRSHWKAFLAEGILLVILGLAAIVVPPIASIAVTVMLGWMFFIAGIAALLMTFWARQAPGFIWSLISAAPGIQRFNTFSNELVVLPRCCHVAIDWLTGMRGSRLFTVRQFAILRRATAS